MFREHKQLRPTWNILLIWCFSLSVALLLYFQKTVELSWILLLTALLITQTLVRLFKPGESSFVLMIEGSIIAVSLLMAARVSAPSYMFWLLAFLWCAFSVLEIEKYGNTTFYLLVVVLSYVSSTFLFQRQFPSGIIGEIVWTIIFLLLFQRIRAFRAQNEKRALALENDISSIKKEAAMLQEEQDLKLRELVAAKVSMEERYAEIYTLQIINEVANSELSIDILGGKVVDILTGLTGSTACSVILLNQEQPPSILATNITSPAQLSELTGPEAIGLFERTMANEQTIISAKLEEESLLKRRGSQSFITVPLRLKTGGFGVIFAEHNVENAFNSETRKIVMAAADRLAAAIDNARLYDRMERMAITDALTGVYNRLYLHQVLTKLVNEKSRIALSIMDVDHFKKVNDTYGHLSGDAALKSLTALAKNMLPSNGMIARYGGEEFVVLLTDAGVNEMMELAEEIRLKTQQMTIHGEKDITFNITASFGVSSMPEYSTNAEGLLHFADQALYHAKETGRNRVCLAVLSED